MTVQPLKSKLITILVHVLVWAVFGFAVFFYHPLFSGIDIPYQAWIKQTLTLILPVAAFYINVAILVPRFLLNNQFGYYFVMFIALVAGIVFINRWVENALDARQVFPTTRREAEFTQPPARIKSPPRRPIDRATIIISALLLGIGTSITAIQKWQKDQYKDAFSQFVGKWK